MLDKMRMRETLIRFRIIQRATDAIFKELRHLCAQVAPPVQNLKVTQATAVDRRHVGIMLYISLRR